MEILRSNVKKEHLLFQNQEIIREMRNRIVKELNELLHIGNHVKILL